MTQFSYDDAARLQCTAVRMNPAVFGAPMPASCALSTYDPAQGYDRIAKND